MKKRFILAILFVALGLIFVACNGETTATPTTTTPTTTLSTTEPTSQPTTALTTQPTTVQTTTESTTSLPDNLDLLPDLNEAPGKIYGAYNLALNAGVATIDYNKYGYGWTEMAVMIDEDVDYFNKLVVTAKGDGVLLVRFVGTSETYDARLTLGVNNQTFQINLRDEDSFLETLEEVVLIAAPGDGEAKGTVEISELKFDIGTAFGTVVELDDPGYVATYGWVENDADTYDITTELDDSVTFAYTKLVGQEWVFAKNDLDSELTIGYNKLTVMIEGTATKQVLIKLNNKYETSVTFDGTVQTIDIDVPETVTQIMLFAEGGTAPVTGEFSLKSMLLTYEEPEPSSNEFTTADITTAWVDNDGGIYTFTPGDGFETVSWTKTAGQEWAFIKNEFTGMDAYNTITMTVKGTVGQQIIIKPNDKGAFEKTLTFDGEMQTIVLPMTEAPTKVLMFVDPIIGSLTGSFEIHEFYAWHNPEGTAVNYGWTENDADTYDITTDKNGIVTVDYTKAAAQGWVYMSTTFDTTAADGMNLLMIALKGTAGKSVLLKPNDNNALETTVTFKDDQTHYVFVSADSFTKMIIFAEPGTESVSGSFEILRMVLRYVEPEALPRDSVVDFESGWVDNGDDVYTIVEDGGVTTVTYDKGTTEWSTMKYVFADNLSLLNTVTLVVQGTSGKQIMFKYGTHETPITFDGTEQTITIPLVEVLTEALIFAEGGTSGVTGSFDIISATVSFVATPLDITNGWAENDSGTYTIDQDNVDGSVVVNYATTDTYQFMINTFDLEDTVGLNTLTIVVQGTTDNEILLKPNDQGAMETTVTFDGTEQTFTFTADVWSKFLIFAAPGVTGGETGSFTIVSLTLTYVEPVE